MQAADYFREKGRMCEAVRVCRACPIGRDCKQTELANPEEAIKAVKEWAQDNPIENTVLLTGNEPLFLRIYIDKGYLWAARDKDGALWLYMKCPDRSEDEFDISSPVKHSKREVLGDMFKFITWENSPICLPKLRAE